MYDGLLNHIQSTNVHTNYIRKNVYTSWIYTALLGLGVGVILGQML